MKIGVIASGNDMLLLWNVLHTYNFSYAISYDDMYRSYGDSSYDVVKQRISDAMEYLASQGVEKYILPPTFELEFQSDHRVLPLFRTYLQQYCFQYSLVGKIGLVGEYCDSEHAQKLVSEYAKTYTLTSHQSSIKSFHFPFSYWFKEVSLWKHYLSFFSYSSSMVNKSIKHDMRYMKDAAVDTIIPLNYGFFAFQKTLQRFFTFSKTRFHGWDALTKCFEKCVDLSEQDIYEVKVFHTDQAQFLKKEKRLMWLLARGKQTTIEFVHVRAL